LAAVTPETDTANAVWRRLLAPAQSVTFAELATGWRSLEISVVVPRFGSVAANQSLLSDLRGAVGRALMAGASPASLAGGVCDWEPPCANDVFFGPKPALRVSRHTHEIPKPLVLSAVPKAGDLVLTLRLFGFACDWAGEVRAALAEAARERLDWKWLAQGLFLGDPAPIGVHQRSPVLVHNPVDIPQRTVMRFMTPIDCKNTDPVDRPESILSRLASRVWLLARWQDATVEVDWSALSSAWRNLEISVAYAAGRVVRRSSTRTGKRFVEQARELELDMVGNLSAVWPLLVIGEQAHVGRGTTAGLGRYILELAGS